MNNAQPPFATNASYPIRLTNDLEFFVDGEESFAAIAAAVEQAQRYVYITCCYTSLNFRMRPPAQEQLLDLCHRTATRGVRVALLFWQPVTLTGQPDTGVGGTVPYTLLGTIKEYAPGVLARWDQAKGMGIYPDKASCHHQKTFVIDGQVAFVGGINMTQEYWDTPAHKPNDERRISYDLVDQQQRQTRAQSPQVLPLHDMFCRFAGPAVGDVEANFVERWNGATRKEDAPDLSDIPGGAQPPSGTQIQVLRTIAPHTYPHTAAGEQSIEEAIVNALRGAKSSVYFENQYFFDPDVVGALRSAAMRGVRIVGLLTRAPDAGQLMGRVEHVLELPAVQTFQWTLGDPHIKEQVQLYSPYTEGSAPNKDIYVHAKVMIVDDRYVIVGSANISFTSMDFHSEMCVLVDDARRALALRRRLFAEHLCLSESQIPEEFGQGADVWHQHGAANAVALQSGQVLRSRVVPLEASL